MASPCWHEFLNSEKLCIQMSTLQHYLLLMKGNGFVLTECTLNRVELQYRALPDTGFFDSKKLQFWFNMAKCSKIYVNKSYNNLTNEEFIRWNQMTLLCYCDVRVISWSWFSKFSKNLFSIWLFCKKFVNKMFQISN